MELFIPSLLVLILSGVVLTILLPKFSLYTLGLLSIGLFLLGLYQHWKTFPYEYSMSETKQIMKDYAPFITLLLTILGLIAMALQLSGGATSSGKGIADILPELPAMPVLNMPKMPEMPALNMPKIPNMGMGMGGANNIGPIMGKNKNNFNINPLNGIMGMNNMNKGKRNNIASNNFRVT